MTFSSERSSSATMVEMTNGQIRAWYCEQIGRIALQDADAAAARVPLEARARQTFESRRQARITARSLMESKEEVKLLEARDQTLYDRSDGPSFEDLVQKHQAAGFSTDEILRLIIDSATRTNSEFDRRFGAS